MKLNDIIEAYNYFDDFGFSSLKKPLSLSFYESWLEKGYHGEMKYLKAHLDTKKDPQKLMKRARSAIVMTKNYLPHPEPKKILKNVRVALYAQGKDYHYWFQEKLNHLCKDLQKLYPSEEFIAFSDSKPVLERDLAYKAGLGWFGKNSCIINEKKGSLFFIGEIYTTLNLQSFKPLHPDRCGTCTKCIDACPTDAIVKNKTLDARKCISYLTIESKKNPPENLRSKIGDWLFGCDICQTVCPWNEKAFGVETFQTTSQKEERENLAEDLRWILENSNKQLQKNYADSPLSRAGANGLKRNAIVVATNKNLTELSSCIKNYLDHEKLSELAKWSLEQLEKVKKIKQDSR